MDLDRSIVETLSNVSTATITTILLKQGLRNVWMRGTHPLQPGQPRRVGRAFTLRFVPAREDLATPESTTGSVRQGSIEVYSYVALRPEKPRRALMDIVGML